MHKYHHNSNYNKIKQLDNIGLLFVNNNLNYSLQSLKKALDMTNIDNKSIIRYHYVKTVNPSKTIKSQINKKHIEENKNLVKFVKYKLASAPKLNLQKMKPVEKKSKLMEKIDKLLLKEKRAEKLQEKRAKDPKLARARLSRIMREYKRRDRLDRSRIPNINKPGYIKYDSNKESVSNNNFENNDTPYKSNKNSNNNNNAPKCKLNNLEKKVKQLLGKTKKK